MDRSEALDGLSSRADRKRNIRLRISMRGKTLSRRDPGSWQRWGGELGLRAAFNNDKLLISESIQRDLHY